jgi:hypothetical protein
MDFFKNLFKKKKAETIPEPEFTQEQYDLDYEQKEAGLEAVLGKMYNIVGHAIIPFAVGGAVDMYYFLDHIPGTGFATMELLDPNGNGPKPNRLGTYELVAFTKQQYNSSEETKTAFNIIERRICGILTTIGNFSFQATLNPNETCEIPDDKGDNNYLIFDNYRPHGKEFEVGERKHHLLLCMELLKSEMEFARANGGEKLLNRLKDEGFYPYSDLDRTPVA